MKKGFTIIELLVGITISAIIITIVVSSLTIGLKSYQFVSKKVEYQRNARLVAERLIREVKKASFIDPVSDGGNLIFSYTLYDFSSNPITSTLFVVRYYVDNRGILRRQVKQGNLWVGNNPLTENDIKVILPTFYYYNDSGVLTSSKDASWIQVLLKLDGNMDDIPDYTLTSTIFLPVKSVYFLK
ncbi:MAG TPA: prepilin-type N-terminal cleavage/methylation domain-containing protein [Dictyoglomaceae bacterium]|nr:prepilin-type N-terminal cleavage/methylation domain-containing protein [Dictyoglomaceae bacterium]HOL38791.1 prepilin-type N-terminal cleavage/methylation domain-containing protein [Dictyoglomaceae bacterium]HOP94506.1 prepilin-type N-terminal cleavage/methylation domain-containing protein [Dictyoglomaceae bacterium]HPP15461.1 prepilin-type N-terminal cleavage/methylation domain-containing protein [Dictyoglomaceae bacterium]HPU43239.1 prepilin-type N-terminal cleavage/methylation domain-con